jgi:hypothetical protein
MMILEVLEKKYLKIMILFWDFLPDTILTNNEKNIPSGAIQMNFEPVRNSQKFEKIWEIFTI